MLIYVDTNVWYPVSVADLILRSVEDRLLELAWSEAGLAELARVLVENKSLAPTQVQVFTEQIRRTAPHGCVQPGHYEHFIGSMTGPDPGDYLHSGAARGAGADVLVTYNIRDFPAQDVGVDLRVLDPDELFSEVVAEYPRECVRIISEMAKHRTRPKMTEFDIVAALRRNNLNRFAETLSPSGELD